MPLLSFPNAGDGNGSQLSSGFGLKFSQMPGQARLQAARPLDL